MSGLLISAKNRFLVGKRIKEVDVSSTTLDTAQYFDDLTAMGVSFVGSRLKAELNSYPSLVKNNASLALTPSANGTGAVYAMNGDTKSLERFSFQRGSGATYFDESGTMQLAGIDQPRIDFENGISKGLLIEPSSTNLIPFSGMNNYGNLEAIHPLDVVFCTQIVEAGKSCIRVSGTDRLRFNGIPIQPYRHYTYSFWIKSNTAFSLALTNYDENPYGGTSYQIDGSWKRIVKTFSTNPTTERDVLHFGNESGQGLIPEFYIADLQLEVGMHATSYIPTGAAIATRLADRITSNRPITVFPKNSLNLKTGEQPMIWFGNGVQVLSIPGRNHYSDVSTTIQTWEVLNFEKIFSRNGFNITGEPNKINGIKFYKVLTTRGSWTISGFVRGTQNAEMAFDINFNDQIREVVNYNSVSNEWRYFEHTFFASDVTFPYNFINLENFWHMYYEFRDIKIEQGTQATPWTPAPENYIKEVGNGDLEISSDRTVHVQQFSLIGRELKQEEI